MEHLPHVQTRQVGAPMVSCLFIAKRLADIPVGIQRKIRMEINQNLAGCALIADARVPCRARFSIRPATRASKEGGSRPRWEAVLARRVRRSLSRSRAFAVWVR